MFMNKNNILEPKNKNINLENERIVYTVQEVAALLHSSPNYIYLLIEKGYLPALKLGSIKILKTSLQKFLIDNEGQDLSDVNNAKILDIIRYTWVL